MPTVKIHRVFQMGTMFWKIKIRVNNEVEHRLKNDEPLILTLPAGEHTLRARTHFVWYSKPLRIHLHEGEEIELLAGSNHTYDNSYDYISQLKWKEFLFLEHKDIQMKKLQQSPKKVMFSRNSPVYLYNLIICTLLIIIPFLMVLGVWAKVILVATGVLSLIEMNKFADTGRTYQSVKFENIYGIVFFLLAPISLYMSFYETMAFWFVAILFAFKAVWEYRLAKLQDAVE